MIEESMMTTTIKQSLAATYTLWLEHLRTSERLLIDLQFQVCLPLSPSSLLNTVEILDPKIEFRSGREREWTSVLGPYVCSPHAQAA